LFETSGVKIGPTVRPGRVPEKNGQDSQKSQKVLYFTCLGRSPTEPICTEICTVVAVSDIITWAKFQTKIFRSYGFTLGRISLFLLIIAWSLQQCSVNALRVIWSVLRSSFISSETWSESEWVCRI